MATFSQEIRDKRYVEAGTALTRAIEIRRELSHSLATVHSKSLASTLANYGTLKQGMGELNEAQKALEEALGIYEKNSKDGEDPTCPDLARTMYNLGNVYCQQCNFESGRGMYTRAAHIQEELVLTQPYLFEPKLAKTYSGLGIVLNLLGDHEQSKNVFARALAISRKFVSSERCSDVEALSISLTNYGNTLSSLGELDSGVPPFLVPGVMRVRVG